MSTTIVALDLPTADEAISLVDRLGEAIGWYKVGAPLFTRSGPAVIEELHARGKRVFLDLKYHDIPNTVAQAVDAAAELGVAMLTLHAAGGASMLRAAREAVGSDGPRLLGVTLLTSFTAEDIEQVWDKELRSMREEVARLAALAASSPPRSRPRHSNVATARTSSSSRRGSGRRARSSVTRSVPPRPPRRSAPDRTFWSSAGR